VADAIRITGLKEFQRGLRRMDAGLAKALRVALNNASDVVIDHALPTIPRRTGKAAASLKAKSTQKAVRVAGGSNRAPHYPWLDFGGRVGRRGSARRAFLKRGRYLYKAYDDHRGDFERVLWRELIAVAEASGIRVD
jgi:hypothetical protein